MKIVKLRIDRLKIPLKKPYVLSKEYGVVTHTEPVVVTAYTDEGIVGYGECDPWELFTGDAPELTSLLLKNRLGPAVIGLDPRNIQGVHIAMDRAIRHNHLPKSAIDVACYDILGKFSGLPVHTLLGGKRRDMIRVMSGIGGGTPEESAAEVLAYKKAGYGSCMIKIGGEDYINDVNRTIAVREAVGPDFQLIADANQGWDVETAIQYGRKVKGCGLLMFEQPVQNWDVAGLARIRRALDIPISADEGVATIHDALNLIKAEAVDIFSIKVTKHGGIYPAHEICMLAKEHGIELLFNSMLEEGITQAASLSLGATVSNLKNTGHAYFSPQRLDADITSYSTLRKGDTVSVSDKPGLGVDVYPDVIARYCTETLFVEA